MMLAPLILSIVALIVQYFTGFVALILGETRVALSLILIIFLQLILSFQLLNLAKKEENEAKV